MAYFHSIFSFFLFLPPHESQSLLLPTSSLFFPTRLFFLCLHHMFSFTLSSSPFILFSFVCPPSLSPYPPHPFISSLSPLLFFSHFPSVWLLLFLVCCSFCRYEARNVHSYHSYTQILLHSCRNR